MCGIIAVVRRPLSGEVEPIDWIESELQDARDAATLELAGLTIRLESIAQRLNLVNNALRQLSGVWTLIHSPQLREVVNVSVNDLQNYIGDVDSLLDGLTSADVRDGGEDLESVSAALIRCKDELWAISVDRKNALERVEAQRHAAHLHVESVSISGVGVLLSLHQALSALDRLEVRGRDSAGIEVQLSGHGLDFDNQAIQAEINRRSSPLFTSSAVERHGDTLVIVYKTAAEIGELGDNTAAIWQAIGSDWLLHQALAGDHVQALVMGHTRWASIGNISEANAHPQISREVGVEPTQLVTAVLNGDVDNYGDLTAADGLRNPTEITTDAKVIPTLIARRLDQGNTPNDAFRSTVTRLEGSVAIAALASAAPESMYLALRGSGQALYVGVANDSYIVASEPYGVIEETATYLRLDGETPADELNPAGSRGQIVELSVAQAGTVEGIARWSYDGTELPLGDDDLQEAPITTRDIDRGEFPHFLLKEINDSPESFRKTLRGKLVERDGAMHVMLGTDVMPAQISQRLQNGQIQRIQIIGQGTAAIAGQSLAHHLSDFLAESVVEVEAILATELSGFHLRSTMDDTLIIAISQSGTTTDTNRTVDLVRARGASVIAIVNRRGSDLTDKADGVLYTSDGRDVEMSVASTKAFYAQVAAGLLLAQFIADLVPSGLRSSEVEQQELLRELLQLPPKMKQTIALRSEIARAAREFLPARRYWAIVGNGLNQIAARELRIKLSELCYKSIACDGTEDKKHIDLSSEPMILVCAAGLHGSTADDVSKEVAIFRAHQAVPIVICSESDREYNAAYAVISVPDTHSRLAFVLGTMAGHLFGYEAALAIDAQAQVLRTVRSKIDHAVETHHGEHSNSQQLLDELQPVLHQAAMQFADLLRSGDLNGHLEASTAVRLSGQFRYGAGISHLDQYQLEFGRVGTPDVVVEGVVSALSDAIEELTRPVDAIKHQAKTVTVGISRSDESLLQIPLVQATLEAGATRDRLSYATLRTLGELDPAVKSVTGFVSYDITHGENIESARIALVDRSGVAATLVSRVEKDPRLRGTKALVAREQELMVATGRSDGRTVVIIPEVKNGITTGLVLLHVEVAPTLPSATTRSVLRGYRRRYDALKDAVTETEDSFRDDLLERQPLTELLTLPILDLAERWRAF